MAINVTLQQLSTLNNTSILAQSNANFSTIQTALLNALSLNGQAPNQMATNLDMNSNQILNLPPPATPNSPARLVDVVSNPNLLLTVPPVGTSGAVVGLLNANNTVSGITTFTNNVNITGGAFNNLLTIGSVGAQPGVINFQGSTSGASAIGVNNTGLMFVTSQNGQLIVNAITGNNGSIALAGSVSGSCVIGALNNGGFFLNSTNGITIQNNNCFGISGAIAATIPNVPAGGHSTPQTWLIITDNNGTVRYIPCF